MQYLRSIQGRLQLGGDGLEHQALSLALAGYEGAEAGQEEEEGDEGGGPDHRGGITASSSLTGLNLEDSRDTRGEERGEGGGGGRGGVSRLSSPAGQSELTKPHTTSLSPPHSLHLTPHTSHLTPCSSYEGRDNKYICRN